MAEDGRGAHCHACERAAYLVRGAKCAMHESSTSPSVDRARRIYNVPGDLGPVPLHLIGALPRRDT